MKRIISLILCFVLALPFTNACAEETFYKLYIDAGNGKALIRAYISDGEIYIKSKDYERFTKYQVNEEKNLFVMRNQYFDNAYKSVKISEEKKKIFVNNKELDLDNFFRIEDELYLPFSQMLPLLNATIYEIKDNIIYIANPEISLAEILYELNIENICFNYSEVFDDNPALDVDFTMPAYIYDTVTNWRYDRLDSLVHMGDYNDYKDIFSELLAKDNLYLKAKAENNGLIDNVVEIFSAVDKETKTLKSTHDWIVAACKTDSSYQQEGVLLDVLQEVYELREFEKDKGQELEAALLKDEISFSDVVEILNYAYTCTTLIKDTHNMLASVYDVDNNVNGKDVENLAAKYVYDLYGEEVAEAVVGEVLDTVIKDAGEEVPDTAISGVADTKTSPLSIYNATAKISEGFINKIIPYNAGEVSKLHLYSNIVSSSLRKYFSYGTETDEETNNLRMSLLLCMTASKRCFEIMKSTCDGSNIDSSFYQNKIEKIDKLIISLYMAAESTELDSFEHFDEYKEYNKKLLKDSKIIDNIKNNPFYEYNILKNYFFENYSTSELGFLADVTNDGIYELIVVKEDSEDIDGYVYSVKEDKVVCLEKMVGGHGHFDGYFSWYITDINGSVYLVDENFPMWQGAGSVETIVYNLSNNGERINVDEYILYGTLILQGDDMVQYQTYKGITSTDGWASYKSDISDIVGNAYEIYSNRSESDKDANIDLSNKYIVFGFGKKNTEIPAGIKNNMYRKPRIIPGIFKSDFNGGGEEYYGIIEIKSDGTYILDTTMALDWTIGKPIHLEGKYAIESYDSVYPDGTPTVDNMIIFYADGTEYCRYFLYDDGKGFGGHEFAYRLGNN